MHHSGQSNEPKSTGSDMCLVENRDIENFSNLTSSEVANHVWESCRPTGSFMCKSPTVSARRVQLMRVYLQSYVPDPEAETTDSCKKTSKTPPRAQFLCPCGNMRKEEAKTNVPPSSSLDDVMYACPDDTDEDDECGECNEGEEDDDQNCDYE